MEFTGERFIPGESGNRIEEDHLERYYFILGLLEESKKLNILDLACGEGYGTDLISDFYKNSNITGVDLSLEAIEHAKKKYDKKNVNFLQGDATKFNNGVKYDVIVSFETIEHIPFYEAVIQNFSNLLKKGGTLFISSPNRLITSPHAKTLSDKPSNKFHTQEFIKEELIELLEKYGFQIREVYGQRKFLYFKSHFLNKLSNKLLKPDINTSSKVQKLSNIFEPKYFIIEAKLK